MKVLSTEKIKVLAEKNGWSLMWAEGYVDGEAYRRRRRVPSTYAQVGIDEYSLGFRAGFYERQNTTSMANASGGMTVAVVSYSRGRESAESVEMMSVTARVG